MITRRQLLASSAAGLAVPAFADQLTPAQRRPKALVWEIADPWTNALGAADQLKAAGFDVQPLPLDRSPWKLDADVIFLGSFVSESPDYKPYMSRYAKDLYGFVDRGHLLVQMTQADQTESVPPFLPTTHGARRIDPDFEEAVILSPDHPLAANMPSEKGIIRFGRADRRTIWETLVDQDGFQVIIAAEREAIHCGLMEGAYGQGRIVLSAIDLDKNRLADGGVYGTPTQHAVAAAFFANLRTHALNIRDHHVPALVLTPSPQAAQKYVPGSWTLAVMPDTQVYSLRYPGLFVSQTNWILENRRNIDIRYAMQLGDITNNNTLREWQHARSALSQLIGQVPLALVCGNHDYGPSGDATTRDTHFDDFFPVSEARRQPTFAGSMDENSQQNNYHLFNAGGVDWILIGLEWSPRDETVAWANEVMKQYPARRGILITHAYLNNNDLRYDYRDKKHPQDYNPHFYHTPGSKNDGEQLWQKLVRHHDFALVMNGHVLGDGTGYLASRTDRGRTCHQILANYQMRTLGGEGYLRLLEFRPDGKTVQVKTYSTLYDRFMLASDQQFSFQLD